MDTGYVQLAHIGRATGPVHGLEHTTVNTKDRSPNRALPMLYVLATLDLVQALIEWSFAPVKNSEIRLVVNRRNAFGTLAEMVLRLRSNT